jgi:hypothetical protein
VAAIFAGDPDSRAYRRQLLTIIVGAIIGFVPTAILAVYQAHAQREQLLFDRRLAALHDFSLAASDDGELSGTVAELEVAINHVDRVDPQARTRQDWKRIDSLSKAVSDQRYKWIARLNAEIPVVGALFANEDPFECPLKGSALSYGPHAAATRPDLAKEEREIEYMKQNIGEFKRDLAAIIDSTQATIRCHAAHLD